ncbi:MAG: polyprenyl synthetase family protein [Clostridia bacterium]|nr:polyprenyl synthetase family protein [Clostridia bacterium]
MIDPVRIGARAETVDPASLLQRVAEPLRAVEAEIEDILRSQDAFMFEVATHLLRSGGKRLRPALLLLSVEACGAQPAAFTRVGAALECVHMATLVHDDVVDHADLRRGVPTVHRKWGTRVGVLAGDYLFARAFATLAQVGDNRVVQLMAKVVYEMSAGEIEQQRRAFDLNQTTDDYFRRIYQKTGCFIAECCRLGGVLTGAGEEAEEALRQFGYGVGMGYQIVDDVLDFTSSTGTLGKPVASDLRSGVLTLPVLYALSRRDTGPRLREALANVPWGDAELDVVQECLEDCGALRYSYGVARRLTEEGRRALAALPPSPARDALDGLAQALIDRVF